MVNFKYLKAKFVELLNTHTEDIVKVKLFLSDIDIHFLESIGCLLSLSSDNCTTGQYWAEFDKKHLLGLSYC